MHDVVVVEVPRCRNDDVAADVHRAVVGGERTTADRRDHLARPDHGAAEGVRTEHGLREEVVDELLGRVFVHGDLLEHDLALGVELGERRREDHVRHHVDRRLEVRVRYAGVEDGVLPGCRRVQLAAETVEDLRDLGRRIAGRALEQQVLEEVRDACALLLLVARAGADPVADRDGTDARDPLADHALAGVELRDLVLLHGGIVGHNHLPRCGDMAGSSPIPAGR